MRWEANRDCDSLIPTLKQAEAALLRVIDEKQGRPDHLPAWVLLFKTY